MLEQKDNQKECLYQMIYRELSNDILNGICLPGAQIPTEHELAKQYHVSRITSKKATDMLVANGYIVKIAGRGSFVRAREHANQEPLQTPAGNNPPMLIGVVLDAVSESFGVEVIKGIEEACMQSGYSLVLKFIHNNMCRETESINEMLKIQVSGIILLCGCFETYNQKILELSLQDYPIVFMDRYLPGLPIPYVGTDHELACKELTDAMFAHGHQDLVLAMCDKASIMTSVTERVNGYISSCIQHNEMSCMNRLVVEGDIGMSVPEDKYDASVQLVYDYMLKHPTITGAVALSNGIAYVICAAAELLRQQQGRSFEVACFDSNIRRKPYIHPILSIDQDQLQIGKLAVETLQCKINHGSPGQTTHIPYRLTDLSAQ